VVSNWAYFVGSFLNRSYYPGLFHYGLFRPVLYLRLSFRIQTNECAQNPKGSQGALYFANNICKPMNLRFRNRTEKEKKSHWNDFGNIHFPLKFMLQRRTPPHFATLSHPPFSKRPLFVLEIYRTDLGSAEVGRRPLSLSPSLFRRRLARITAGWLLSLSLSFSLPFNYLF
jgi:hypothetical protein